MSFVPLRLCVRLLSWGGAGGDSTARRGVSMLREDLTQRHGGAEDTEDTEGEEGIKLALMGVYTACVVRLFVGVMRQGITRNFLVRLRRSPEGRLCRSEKTY